METRGQPRMESEQVMKVQEQNEWMTPIVRYSKEGQLPEDSNEARKVQIRAARIIIVEVALYRRGRSLSYLRCANREETNYVR